MTAVRKINSCRDFENERERSVIRFNGYTSCCKVKTEDDPNVKMRLVVTDDDDCNPICRIDFLRAPEPDDDIE